MKRKTTKKAKLDYPGLMKVIVRVRREIQLSVCIAATYLVILWEVKGGFVVPLKEMGA